MQDWKYLGYKIPSTGICLLTPEHHQSCVQRPSHTCDPALWDMVTVPEGTPETGDTMFTQPPAGVPMPPSPAVPVFEQPRHGSAVRHLMHAGCIAIDRTRNAELYL